VVLVRFLIVNRRSTFGEFRPKKYELTLVPSGSSCKLKFLIN